MPPAWPHFCAQHLIVLTFLYARPVLPCPGEQGGAWTSPCSQRRVTRRRGPSLLLGVPSLGAALSFPRRVCPRSLLRAHPALSQPASCAEPRSLLFFPSWSWRTSRAQVVHPVQGDDRGTQCPSRRPAAHWWTLVIGRACAVCPTSQRGLLLFCPGTHWLSVIPAP